MNLEEHAIKTVAPDRLAGALRYAKQLREEGYRIVKTEPIDEFAAHYQPHHVKIVEELT